MFESTAVLSFKETHFVFLGATSRLSFIWGFVANLNNDDALDEFVQNLMIEDIHSKPEKGSRMPRI